MVELKERNTLLHRDADCLPQNKSDEDGKKETEVAALITSEQVLLMTCIVKVTVSEGSRTVARAVIDPGSSASYVHK